MNSIIRFSLLCVVAVALSACASNKCPVKSKAAACDSKTTMSCCKKK